MLPIMTSSEDVEKIVSYLKTKATGATKSDIKSVIEDKYADNRKLNAYETWGFITRNGGNIKLTERGRKFSRASEDGKRKIYRKILKEVNPYNMALEWMFHQNIEKLTNIEVAAHWHEHCPEELGSDNETTIKKQVVCLFKIAEAAGIGSYTLGRGGKSTRIQVDQDKLGQLIAEKGLAAKSEESIDDQESDEEEKQVEEQEESTEEITEPVETKDGQKEKQEDKVFISHGKNKEIVDQIKMMLEFADLEYEIATEEETTAIPVPEKVMSSMRNCNAAVICVTADEDSKTENGEYFVNQNVLIEIGAAFVLYDKRVVLVWDERLPVPSNLQGLYRSEFEGNELSWSSGMKLMNAIKNFRN